MMFVELDHRGGTVLRPDRRSAYKKAPSKALNMGLRQFPTVLTFAVRTIAILFKAALEGINPEPCIHKAVGA